MVKEHSLSIMVGRM